MNQKIKAVIIIVAIALLISAAIAIAASQLTVTSNDSEPITPISPPPSTSPTATTEPTVTATEYTLTLAWNTTTPFLGESVQFTATLNPSVENVTVFFYRKTPTQALLGNASTNQDGIAVFDTAPLTGTASKVYVANCTLTIP